MHTIRHAAPPTTHPTMAVTTGIGAHHDFDAMVCGLRSAMEREAMGMTATEDVEPSLLYAGYAFALVAGRVAHKLTREVDTLRERIRQMSEDHLALMAIDKGLAASVATLTEQNAALTAAATEAQHDRAGEAKRYRLGVDNDVLRAALDTELEEVQCLHALVAELEEEARTVAAENVRAEELLEYHLRAEHATEMDALREELKAAHHAASNAEEVDELRKQLAQAKEEVEEWRATNAVMRTETEELRAAESSLRTEVGKLRASAKEADRVTASLRVKLDTAVRARSTAMADADTARVEAAACRATTDALTVKVEAQISDIVKMKAMCTEALRESHAIRVQAAAESEAVAAKAAAENETVRSMLTMAQREAAKSGWYRTALMGDDPAQHTLARVIHMTTDILDKSATPADIRHAFAFVHGMIDHLRADCMAMEVSAAASAASHGMDMHHVTALVRILTTNLLDDNGDIFGRLDHVHKVACAHGAHADVLEAVDGLRCVMYELAAHVRDNRTKSVKRSEGRNVCVV